MSDPRFARLKSDPRFRRVRKKEAKVVVDDRFKSIFDEDKGKKKDKKGKGRVDKYGRPLSKTHEQDNLRRFYRVEGEEDERTGESSSAVVDYARGAVLLESSDEEDGAQASDDDSDAGGIVTLGADVSKPIRVALDDEEPEVDLDEEGFADLDAQAAQYSATHEDEDENGPDTNRTRRLAVVNLDWDHVRAIHLYKIFTSLVSPTAPPRPSGSSSKAGRNKAVKGDTSVVVRGKVLSVRVYTSEFGKERLAREEKEGPPPEVFTKKDEVEDEDDIVLQVGDAEDYNEEALRKYQLERLRYYYAIVECDSVAAASHLYDELEGTELERTANVFDMSFVPDEMTFDEAFRDEATEDVNAPYKPVEYVTDALRHSKVKLTWDEDDPERNQVTRRALTRQEIEENDFKAYLASSTESESEDEADRKGKGKADREKLRALLLSGEDGTLPEGWGTGFDDEADGVDMEVTFTPGLSESKGAGADETTLEKYQRKMREKNKKRKAELKEKKEETVDKARAKKGKDEPEDDFFAGASDEESEGEADGEDEPAPKPKKGKNDKKGRKHRSASPETEAAPRVQATAEELALLAASDNPNGEPKHFDMKAVIRAEKHKGKKRKGKKSKNADEPADLQDDFAIDVKDDRFKAVLEDHTYAIDPSNPHFQKTKSMTAILDERSKRQKHKRGDEGVSVARPTQTDSASHLHSLVESVKRKSAAADEKGIGKRRRV